MKQNNQSYLQYLLSVIGPGILYAAAAVGLSHLVQATRAGAYFGLGLAMVVLVACLVKYPLMRFGGEYAAVTGKSLIHSYRQQGRWALYLYSIAQLVSMVFIIAAVSLFTLGLIKASFSIEIDNVLGCSILLVFTVLLLYSGGYRILERFTKFIVLAFTLLLIATVAVVLPEISWSFGAFALPTIDGATFMFIIALIGFMPSPADGSVLQSLWTCARAKEAGKLPSVQDARTDFNVGFFTSVALALMFVVIGAGVMHGTGIEIAKSNGGFARQLLDVFGGTIGGWAFPLMAALAIFVMYSTTITVIDGMTRILAEISQDTLLVNVGERKRCLVLMTALCILAMAVIAMFLKNFATFMDMVSILVFVISPVIAVLNHRAIFHGGLPSDSQPSDLIRYWSLFGIIVLSAMSLGYFMVRFIL